MRKREQTAEDAEKHKRQERVLRGFSRQES